MDFSLTLPIVEITNNIFTFIGIGLTGGVITGLLGLGGGMTITPLLIMIGVPPLAAVTNQVNSALGITFTGFLSYFRQNDVDVKLGIVAMCGGFIGVFVGVKSAAWFEKKGVMLFVMSLGYIVVLFSMGTLLLWQSLKNLKNKDKYQPVSKTPGWLENLPLKTNFPRLRLTMSVWVPFGLGSLNAFLTVLLGIGNGVVMLPLLTYLIGRTSPVVYGTSQLASVVMFLSTTFLMTLETASLDLVLVFFLLIGGTIGTQVGVYLSYFFRRVYLGIGGAVVIYAIGLNFLAGLLFESWCLSSCVPSFKVELSPFYQEMAFFTHTHPFWTACIGIGMALLFSLAINALSHFLQSFFKIPSKQRS